MSLCLCLARKGRVSGLTYRAPPHACSNGEGIRGFVEDLNVLVTNHVQRRFALSQSTRQRAAANPSINVASLVTGLITADLTDLVRTGLTTLAHKLAPPAPAQPLDDGRLLARLNEVWLFFFTGILPHLEAVFWVLRADDRLRAAVEPGTRTSRGREEGRIDVRRIALIEFRDEILHPEMARLVPLFSHVYRGGGLPGGGGESEYGSRPGSRRPSVSSSHPAPPPRPPGQPDIRRARSHPHPPSRPLSPVTGASTPREHPQPHRQYSSPPRLSPDPNYVASFPPPASPSGAPYPRYPPAAVTPSSGPAATTVQAFARRRQMVAVLAALRTDDDRQGEMDALLRVIRPSPTPRARYQARQGGSDESGSPAPEAAGGPSGYGPRGDRAYRPSGGEDGDLPGSGAATGLTGSPAEITDEPSSLSSHGEGADVLRLPLPLAPPIPSFATATSPLPSAIDARQRHRSRTMDSLDEEDAHAHGHGHAHATPLPARVPAPPSPVPPLPLPPSRASSDGSRGLSAAQLAELQQQQQAPAAGTKKARRRSSFLPGFKRSNSNASSTTSASVATTLDPVGSDDDALAVPGGGAGGGGGTGGDKLRRGLLRRNSSRRAAVELVGAGAGGPALGAAGGFAVEDDE